MEYWNRNVIVSGTTTTTQASTVSTTGKPITPSPSSGEIFNLSTQKYIIAVIFYNIIHFILFQHFLRVVQTRTILVSKSMSERVGSDIQRL